ncbi:MAG: GntR family transcriptional regulator [[Clostridium] scindens]
MMRFKYTHLAAWLKEQIKSGTYKDGDRIPTEIELAAQFGVSRDTVRKAISVLEKESLLRKIKRKRHLRAHFLQASSFSRWQGFQTYWHSYE